MHRKVLEQCLEVCGWLFWKGGWLGATSVSLPDFISLMLQSLLPFCKWFWSGFWEPEHLPTGYLEHSGMVTMPLFTGFCACKFPRFLNHQLASWRLKAWIVGLDGN